MASILIFLVVIVALVVAHELGHFFAARAFGVRVDEFGVGYPPRARKLFVWKGTTFTLNWLPFGGFVRIFGEQTEGQAVQADSFAAQRLSKRLLIVAAGIIANFVLAALLYAASFNIGFLGSPSDFPGSIQAGPEQVLVANVIDGTPAAAAGMRAGDVILSVSNGSGDPLAASSADAVIVYVRKHGESPLTLSLEGAGGSREVTVQPVSGISGTAAPALGVELAEAAHIRLPLFRAMAEGARYACAQFGLIVVSIGRLIGGLFVGDTGLLSQVSGPVGIARFAGAAYTFGAGAFLSFVALISVNLAVINLLPLPALDGGRLVLEFFASRGRSRIPPRAVALINQLGFLLLILLMVLVTYRDIRHLAG